MSTLESSIETQLQTFCDSYHIQCLKLKLASESAWPDRTLLYRGQVMFLELKRDGEKPRPLQQFVLDDLRSKGFRAEWADNLAEAKRITLEWRRYVIDHC